MYRNKTLCSELGEFPDKWSRHTPLPPPRHFAEAYELTLAAMKLIKSGNRLLAIQALQNPLEIEIKNWYIEHGRMSGDHRFRVLGGLADSKYQGPLDPVKSVNKIEQKVYLRDSYKCKYCSNSVLSAQTLKQIEEALGLENFAVLANSNKSRHGFIYTIRATADHVTPHNRGGLTSMDNLVTACWSCNYGKGGYSLKEIALDDPR